MIVTKIYLEEEVTVLNQWLVDNHNVTSSSYWRTLQKRKYYVDKLCEIDEYNLINIKI